MRAALEPRVAQAQPEGAPWAFHADFYDGTGSDVICHVQHHALGPDVAESYRKMAELMLKAAQGFRRQAEELDPRYGPPVFTASVHQHGMQVITIDGPLTMMTNEEIGERFADLGRIVAERRTTGGET